MMAAIECILFVIHRIWLVLLALFIYPNVVDEFPRRVVANHTLINCVLESYVDFIRLDHRYGIAE